MEPDGAVPGGIADLKPVFESMKKEQRAWYWYDWANSAYVTTIATVLFLPYLTAVAEQATCGFVSDDARTCEKNLHFLFVPMLPGTMVFLLVTLATLLSALILPVVGAIADRSERKKSLLGLLAWSGALAAGCMYFVAGTNWQLGAVLLVLANICLGASLVVYDAILCEIALPDERDHVSSRGWALGYLGGGLLLAVNLAVVSFHDSLGLSTGMAVRLSLLSAAVWWAAFTLIPYLGLRNRPPVNVVPEQGSLLQQSFGQLWTTLRDLANYPQTRLFLLAYLFYNDGIQTVIASASQYGQYQLHFSTQVLMGTILLVQFVAFGGAMLFGRLAKARGAYRVILGGIVVWMLIVTFGFVLPAKNLPLFLVMAVGIGLVMGGTQALSRSFFSQLIPRGREAEYFGLYQACERGTSWLGTAIFAIVHQLTHSYRPAILALIVFFVAGGMLLYRVKPREGVAEAGNTVPAVI